MAPFLYFLPTLTREQLFPKAKPGRPPEENRKLDRSVLAAAGDAARLLDVLGDVESMDDVGPTEIARGPTGSSGLLLVALPNDRSRHHVQGYYPDQQTWTPIGEGKTCWLGVDNGHLPEPADLARRKFHRGVGVELADDNHWTVPVVRRPAVAVRHGLRDTELPRSLTYGPGGNVIQTIKRQYRAAWEQTAEICDLFFTADGVRASIDCTVQWGLDHALAILALNYRLGTAEQNALELIDSENFLAILATAIDLSFVLDVIQATNEAQKKRDALPEPAMPSSPTGAPAETDDTGPAAAIST